MPGRAERLARGWRLHQAGNPAGAEQVYREALGADPDDADAWCFLGMACHDQDRLEEAVAAYRRALRLRPRFPIALNNLGNTLRQQRRIADALACYDQALQLDPSYLVARRNKGTALVWEGRLEEALACYRRALEGGPEDADTHKDLGVALLLLGRFEEGWPEYEWRARTTPAPFRSYAQPRWDGAPLDGRTILLAAEQGLGDTVQFVRYAAVLKQKYDCRVIVAGQASLLPLLASGRGIDRLVARTEAPPAFDVWAPLLSLPGILRDTPETFPREVPYLSADPALVARWTEALAPYGGRRIGLCWQGSPKHQADRMRSVPLAELAPLARLMGFHLVSLQKGPGTEQLDAIGGALPIVTLGDDFDGAAGAFMDSAAVLTTLDLLVTADTAIAHVAGALGVPTWLLLPYVPDWRWLLGREDSVWYPTVRLFRQPAPGDWAGAVGRLVDELRRTFPTVRRKRPADYRVATSGASRLARTRHGLMVYNRHDVVIGRSLELYGEYSEGETDLFRQVVRPGHVVVEAGANIGAHTLPLSRLVGDRGRVHAFEPQRGLFQMLCANLALSGRTNVEGHCAALGATPGRILVPELDPARPANFGGLALGGHPRGVETPLTTVDTLGLARLDLLKVDVEGMELAVLEGAAETIGRCRPLLYVENDRVERSPALIEWILARGYRLYWHLPALYQPANYFGNPVNVFERIVSSNMLGVHAAVTASITGLRPIERPDEHWMRAKG